LEPILPPKTFKVYTLIKQTGMSLIYTGFSANNVMLGTGFFMSQADAEHHRTMELLKDTATPRSLYHVFELDIPNPAYSEY
jgi:hypothetical protein